MKKKKSLRTEFDNQIIANATRFAIIWRSNIPGKLERMRISKKKAAFTIAQKMAERDGRVYMVYAYTEDGMYGAHVKNFYPKERK